MSNFVPGVLLLLFVGIAVGVYDCDPFEKPTKEAAEIQDDSSEEGWVDHGEASAKVQASHKHLAFIMVWSCHLL